MSKANIIKAIGSFCAAYVCYLLSPADLGEPARRALLIFIVAALFWAFEIIPLFATSLLVILLEMFLLSLPGPWENTGKIGYDVFFSEFGNSVILLFFGGFILARAMNKYHIDRLVASRLLKVFGTQPYFLMLGFMVTTAFLSMWMSDTATTAMMIAMVLPFLSQLKDDNPYRTGLILAIPFSSLIGGMATPVGTPPNAIAIGILAEQGIDINFVSWMKMAVPLAVLLLAAASVVLYFFFPSKDRALSISIPSDIPMDARSWTTIVIALLTIGLWLTSGWHGLPSAVIALLAAGLYAATGLLDKNDFKSINWDVLILMWGGLALGKGIEITGFADYIVSQPFFEQTGIILVAVFCFLAVILSTFMSNTATATLLIPIAVAIPVGHPVILGVTIALSCSLAMVLPVSTPPNAIAFSTDMLKAKDMIRAGAVIALLSVLLILAGYKVMVTSTLGV